MVTNIYERLPEDMKKWWPMSPLMGPPLPGFFGIYWPWYKVPPWEEVVPEVADIRVENLTITPSEVNVGQKITISVTATNYGTIAATKTITCTVT